MKRTATITLVIGLIAVAAFFAGGPWGGRSAEAPSASRSDSVWYHASDVAQLGRTGSPQLVEFFHPG